MAKRGAESSIGLELRLIITDTVEGDETTASIVFRPVSYKRRI